MIIEVPIRVSIEHAEIQSTRIYNCLDAIWTQSPSCFPAQQASDVPSFYSLFFLPRLLPKFRVQPLYYAAVVGRFAALRQ
ncbi:hypothetical protein [Herbaspirillum rubrisubalbicans]|uniref:hypothetical protein n=1 Tax=Herbaspirillum rubrisubalbicans TaxID=80842 RepID=UPI0011BFCD71|nr:hypothetical protein [Herbaspirillum rubrisubalbicans]MCP1572044.1 hypothetical protein [Herbaspirillum rubrisubalbicans]